MKERKTVMPNRDSRKTVKANVPPTGWATFSEDFGPASTFTAEVVHELIKITGLKPLNGLDQVSVGRELGAAVFDFIGRSGERSTDTQGLKWFRQIRTKTLQLLELLGADPRTGRASTDALINLAPPNGDDESTYPIREEMAWLQIRGTRQMETISDDEPAAIEKGTRRKIEFQPGVGFVVPAQFQVVQLAAYAAACIASMADAQAKALGQPERRPRRSRRAEVRLIDDLCRIYKTISGKEATLTPEGPAITFCCKVAKRTLGFLPEAPPSSDRNLEIARKSLLALTNPTSVRDRIRDSWGGGHRAR
jgi:hypothetical protein